MYKTNNNRWTYSKYTGSINLTKEFPTFDLDLKVRYFKIKDKIDNENYANIENDIKIIVSNLIDERKYVKEDIKNYSQFLINDIGSKLKSSFPKKAFHCFVVLSKEPNIILSSFKFINCSSNEFSFGIHYKASHIYCTVNIVIYDINNK